MPGGRPKINPQVQYADVIELLDNVERVGPIEVQCKDEPTAVYMLSRMNRYRKIVRENDERGLTILDNYIFRREGTTISVVVRQFEGIVDIRRLDTGESIPLNPHHPNAPTRIAQPDRGPRTFDPNAPLSLTDDDA